MTNNSIISHTDDFKKLKRIDLIQARKNFTGNKVYTHENIMRFDNVPDILYASNKIICGYYPMKDEIDILPLLRYLSQNNKILIPKTIKGSRILEFGEIDFSKDITDQICTDNPYGIKEPIKTMDKDTLHMDYILVPALAIDKNFQRIGYGGGYYDNTLTHYQHINKDLTSIGICLSNCYLHKEEFPINQYDISLKSILTEIDYISNSFYNTVK